MESTVDLAPDLVVGGRYRLIESLARGGTASVWRALDERLQREVALKILKDEGVDPELRQRAEREAVVLAKLSHPNLVRVLDSGVDDGRPFLVMELLDGRTLHRVLGERGRLEVDEAVNLVADVADGLGVAHAAGVIHRDVKPANIMCNGNVPTVVDFGIARRSDATTMTRGLVLGTASYLAPEQAQGLPLTAAADVYALGCVLYEALTGRPPFEGDGPMAVAFKHVHDSPAPPSSIEASVPLAVDAVVMRCLAKSPADRPVDGAALAAELRAALAPDADATTAVPVVAGAAAGSTMVMPAPVPAAAPARPVHAGPAAVAADAARWRIVAALAVGAIVLLLAWRMLAADDGTVVPALIGTDAATALTELRDAGLEADVFEVDNAAPAGTVVMTEPGPGAEAGDGTTVKVAVSNGAGAVEPAAPPTTAAPAADDDDEGEGRGEGRGKKDKDEDKDD